MKQRTTRSSRKAAKTDCLSNGVDLRDCSSHEVTSTSVSISGSEGSKTRQQPKKLQTPDDSMCAVTDWESSESLVQEPRHRNRCGRRSSSLPPTSVDGE